MKDLLGIPSNIGKKATTKRHLPVVGSKLAGRIRARGLALKALNRATSPDDPGCDDCVGACCTNYLVELTENEFNSGLYDPYAIKLTYEDAKRISNVMAYSALILSNTALGDRYLLEGIMGEYCPFFDNGCTIYNTRPLTCKLYTCATDDRLTEEMKKGTK